MLKLYGFPISNYFNMVKTALYEKHLEFDFVETRPSQEPDYLAKSPMGKVPCIETDDGYLSETQTILEYIEDVKPEPALLPQDPFARAKVRELLHVLELYIELPARRCYPVVFFDGEVTEETRGDSKEALTKGVRALQQLTRFEPHIAGADFSYADIFAVNCLPIANRVTKQLWEWDFMAELPEAADWLQQVNARDSIRRAREEQRAAA